MFWHVGRPNFGDDINPIFWSTMLGRPVHLSRQWGRHLLGVGSIVEAAGYESVVAGSGLIRPRQTAQRHPLEVIAVRGTLTADCLGSCDTLLGDPVVLVDRIFPQSRTREFATGFIPHVSQAGRGGHDLPADCHLIDPRWPPLRVLAEVCRCDRIISQSLHGLIVADAYQIPNAWLAPHEAMIGGEFKFWDYYSTTDVAKSPLSVQHPRDVLEANQVDMFVSHFRFSKSDYMTNLRRRVTELFPNNGN